MKLFFCVSVICLEFALVQTMRMQTFIDDFIDNELYFGYKSFFNTTHDDCVWRNWSKQKHLCSAEVELTLFANGQREIVDTAQSDWLLSSVVWDPTKPNIFFIHGYAGGDNAEPLQLMEEAFAMNGNYNLFAVDYGFVSRAPCYISVVQNIKYVSACFSTFLNDFYAAGMPSESITCIGHSMGAHICGLLKHRLTFPLMKIIGLDPALPMITKALRLTYKAAHRVHTIQTNAGFYGDIGSIGHVDVCVNNGNTQPFCTREKNPNLCSHLWALCFMAQSLFTDYRLEAKKCTKVCPHIGIFQLPSVFPNRNYLKSNDISEDMPRRIPIGLNIPESVQGSYCLRVPYPPFCPKYLNGFGSNKCCSLSQMFIETIGKSRVKN